MLARAGRAGCCGSLAGRPGLSMEVAEAALKFPDAFEPLVKILEIGGLQTQPAGRARYGALFVGITSGQAGMCSHGMEPVPWPRGCAVLCRAMPLAGCSPQGAVAFQQGAGLLPLSFNSQDCPALPYPCALVLGHPRLRNSHG